MGDLNSGLVGGGGADTGGAGAFFGQICETLGDLNWGVVGGGGAHTGGAGAAPVVT